MTPRPENDRTARENPSSNKDAKTRGRTRYEAPRLKRYGDARAITNAVGMNDNKDGGSGPTAKTSF